MKLVSVHVSPAYASSVSELVKRLNVSKPICSNNAAERNVCKVRSVSQLVKPIFSNLVRSINVTKGNVRNNSSVSQLAKTFNVGKPVCSINASNSVLCNSTCKLISNFVDSD